QLGLLPGDLAPLDVDAGEGPVGRDEERAGGRDLLPADIAAQADGPCRSSADYRCLGSDSLQQDEERRECHEVLLWGGHISPHARFPRKGWGDRGRGDHRCRKRTSMVLWVSMRLVTGPNPNVVTARIESCNATPGATGRNPERARGGRRRGMTEGSGRVREKTEKRSGDEKEPR